MRDEPALEYTTRRGDFQRWVGTDVDVVEVTVAIEEFLEKGSEREVGVCEEEEGNLGLGIGGSAQVGVRGARAHGGKAGGFSSRTTGWPRLRRPAGSPPSFGSRYGFENSWQLVMSSKMIILIKYRKF